MLPRRRESRCSFGDIAETSNSPDVQKALRRLTAEMAPVRLSARHVETCSRNWTGIRLQSCPKNGRIATNSAGRQLCGTPELTARGRNGRILFEIEAADEASATIADELKKVFEHKPVLGLLAEIGIPAHPGQPAVACRLTVKAGDALVRVTGSDSQSRNWVALGSSPFPPPVPTESLTPSHSSTNSPRASSTGWCAPS